MYIKLYPVLRNLNFCYILYISTYSYCVQVDRRSRRNNLEQDTPLPTKADRSKFFKYVTEEIVKYLNMAIRDFDLREYLDFCG